MKKLVFILAAVLVSCSQPDTLKVKPKAYVKKESKKKDYSEPYKDNSRSDKGTFYYERYLDTIKVSDEYVIVAVYRCTKGISTVIVGKPTRLD